LIPNDAGKRRGNKEVENIDAHQDKAIDKWELYLTEL
jgi:hypothetical protein